MHVAAAFNSPQLFFCEKLLALVPETVMLVKSSATPPVLVTVTGIAVEAEFKG